jgi:glycosyltransferase involved in cell wall biosynthesis
LIAACTLGAAETARDHLPTESSQLQLSRAVVTSQLGATQFELLSTRGKLTPLNTLPQGASIFVLDDANSEMRSTWLPIAGEDSKYFINRAEVRIEASIPYSPGYSSASINCPVNEFDAQAGRLIRSDYVQSGAQFSIFGRDESYFLVKNGGQRRGWVSKHCLSNVVSTLVGKTVGVIHFGIPPKSAGGVEVNLERHTCELARLGVKVKYIGGLGGGNLTDCAGGNAVSEVIRPEYGIEFQGADALDIKQALLRYRDGNQDAIPEGFHRQVDTIATLLRQDLADIDHVIVHNVHSIPFEGSHAFPVALQQVIKEWASSKPSRRAVFLAHDMPSADRTDLIARLGVTLEQFNNGSRGRYPFDVYSTRVSDDLADPTSPWLSTQIGYGSISDRQRDATAALYQIDSSEISLIPTTGVDLHQLQGPDGLNGTVGLSARVTSVLQRRNILESPALLVYPARLGVPRKRIELAVDAVVEANRLVSPFAPIHLVITGPWQNRSQDDINAVASLRRFICERNANDYITLLAYELTKPLVCDDAEVPVPAIPDFEEVAALMRLAGGLRADSMPGFAFMTTQQEGGGMPQVEAVVAGTEVITTDLDIFKGTLHGISSVIYFPSNASATDIGHTIVTQLQRRFGSPGSAAPARSQASLADIQHLAQRYSWQHIVQNLVVPWLVGTRWVVEP